MIATNFSNQEGMNHQHKLVFFGVHRLIGSKISWLIHMLIRYIGNDAQNDQLTHLVFDNNIKHGLL